MLQNDQMQKPAAKNVTNNCRINVPTPSKTNWLVSACQKGKLPPVTVHQANVNQTVPRNHAARLK